MVNEEHIGADEAVRKIVENYGHERLTVFRRPLRGLFSSCAFNRDVLSSASRVVERDAFGSVAECHECARRALPSTCACKRFHCAMNVTNVHEIHSRQNPFLLLLCSAVELVEQTKTDAQGRLQLHRKDKRQTGVQAEERLWDVLPESLVTGGPQSSRGPHSRMEALAWMQDSHRYMRRFLEPESEGKVPL